MSPAPRCLRGVLRVFQGCSKLKGCSKILWGGFNKGVSRVIQGDFKDVS